MANIIKSSFNSTEKISDSPSAETVVDQVQKIERNAALYRKIDWHILPLMFTCYFLMFLDKIVLNYANVMGLTASLHMNANQFSWLASGFYIAYVIFELAQGFLLQKFPISKVLGYNVFCWGIFICCTSATKNFAGIATLRALLGASESIIGPSMIMMTFQWYTKRQATMRTGVWYSAVGVGQIIGGLISFGAQHGTKQGSFSAWRIMFLAVGVLNLLVALAVILCLPNSVDSAKFLTAEEKAGLQDALTLDQAGNGKRVFKFSSLLEAAADLQTWLLFLLTFCISEAAPAINTFSAVLIQGFGYTPKQSALLGMPSGAVTIFASFQASFLLLREVPHWLNICILMVPTLIGAGLMSFYKGSQGGALAGIYLLNFSIVCLAVTWHWVGSNSQGYTKRIATTGAVVIGFGVANIVGPQTFRAQEAPGYISAKITVFATVGASFVVSALLALLYAYRNRQRIQNRKMQLEAIGRGEKTIREVEEEDMTDLTNDAFLYKY